MFLVSFSFTILDAYYGEDDWCEDWIGMWVKTRLCDLQE